MTTPSIPPDSSLLDSSPTARAAAPESNVPRDAANWARQGTGLHVANVPKGAVNMNVDGRSVVGPLQGFGKLWQKTYRIRLAGCAATPTEIIAAWKANFQNFWPKGNRFYAPLTGITPGEVALLNLRAAGVMPLSTGVMVLYADDESFTLITPEGHMFAGWITFSAYLDGATPMAQTQVQIRANDPIYELGLTFGGHRAEDKFWAHTLTSLAAFFNVKAPVEKEVIVVDPRRQWRYIGNIRYNAAMRTALTAPLRLVGIGRRRTSPASSPAPSSVPSPAPSSPEQ